MKIRMSRTSFYIALLLIITGLFLAGQNIAAYLNFGALTDALTVGTIASGILTLTMVIANVIPSDEQGQ